MKKRLLAWLLFPCLALQAQNDSTLLLAPERLAGKDILFRDLSLQEVKVISATRSPEEIFEQPFTVWVITGEEILRNGFVTLVDVLRAAPGIRVSQPGNAVEGELFLMRGVSGNQYVKILINDVPIKPGITPGMPIGAQLPIRQAERIEVMYGPAGAIYGDEACAGVVNIILKETERPVFTQADLSFGGLSYNSLDLMFGGKLGRDKNIFRYSIYGSSTVRENSDYFYDPKLFNTKNYLPFKLDTNLYLQNDNYRGASSPRDSFARTGALPHESRMFGVNLTWRGIQFTYHRLARFDRSALGLNPLAVSYANPSNRLAERIEAFSIGFQRKRRKRVTQNNFSFTSYQIDNTSTTTYVFDRLSAAVYNARQNPNMTDFQRQALLENIKDNYASDERFAASRGFDARIESRLSTAISSKVLFSAGGQTRLAVGTPLSTYYTIPAPLVFDGVTNVGGPQPIETFTDATIDLNLFAQLEYRGKKMHIVGGTAANMAIFQGLKMSPRLGVLYKIDSAWSVRGSVSTGFRNNNLYAASNTYEIFSTPGTKPSIGQSNYVREHFYAYELGVREHSDNSKLEVFGFLQQVYDMSRPGFFIPGSGVVPSVIYGYNNTSGLSHQIWGAQAMFISESKSYLKVSGLRKETVISGKTELYIQYARGKEWYGNGLPAATSDVLNQPLWTTQFRLFFKLNKNIEIMMAANKQASSLSKSVLYSELFDLPDREERLRKYTTWDVVGRVYLSNHFLVYFNFQNVFDREHQGLDATGTQDDLLYNPQPGRFVRFGVNYNMN